MLAKACSRSLSDTPCTWSKRASAFRTWRASVSGSLRLPGNAYALSGKRKEPPTDARHVRNALARFDQGQGGSDNEREQAFANIKAAARHSEGEGAETDWAQAGQSPHTQK